MAEQARPQLNAPRAEVEAEVRERLGQGEDILQRNIGDVEELDASRQQYRTWDEYNTELLRQRFTTEEVADEYARISPFVIGANRSLGERVHDHKSDVQSKVRRLVSILERLPLFAEAPSVDRPSTAAPAIAGLAEHESARDSGGPVFVVHGRDDGLKEAVARFLSKVTDNNITILHEQANSGRTIIEKLEREGESVSFAVALLSADDQGGLARGVDEDDARLEPRARQNVVFEAGYFVGLLGRDRVALLHEEGIELPSDLAGVLYITVDAGGAWKVALARELSAAGLTVNTDALLT